MESAPLVGPNNTDRDILIYYDPSTFEHAVWCTKAKSALEVRCLSDPILQEILVGLIHLIASSHILQLMMLQKGVELSKIRLSLL